jgi:hypothetical protein
MLFDKVAVDMNDVARKPRVIKMPPNPGSQSIGLCFAIVPHNDLGELGRFQERAGKVFKILNDLFLPAHLNHDGIKLCIVTKSYQHPTSPHLTFCRYGPISRLILNQIDPNTSKCCCCTS